jgi:hypothetical protein
VATIILDPDLKAKLNGLTEQVEVRDANGHTVGHFVPASLYQELVQAWAKTHFTDQAELERARQEVREEGGLATSEAVAHLENVARSAKGAS